MTTEAIEMALLEADEKMEKATAVCREELSGIRTGRVSAQAFNKILPLYYDTPTPLNQLAGISVPEPRVAVISPYDKTSIGAIERAIRESDLGVNPSNDGNIVRVVFPELTEQRRKDLVKVAKTKGEDGKVSIRAVRRRTKDQLEKMQKDGDAGEDDIRRGEKELDDLTKKHEGEVEQLMRSKESDLMGF